MFFVVMYLAKCLQVFANNTNLVTQKELSPFLLYFILTKNVFVMNKKLTLLGFAQEKKCYSLGTIGSPVQGD